MANQRAGEHVPAWLLPAPRGPKQTRANRKLSQDDATAHGDNYIGCASVGNDHTREGWGRLAGKPFRKPFGRYWHQPLRYGYRPSAGRALGIAFHGLAAHLRGGAPDPNAPRWHVDVFDPATPMTFVHGGL